MHMQTAGIITLLVLATACGSRRIAGYLEDLQGGSSTADGASETGVADGSGSSSDTGVSGDGAETTSAGSGSGSASTSTDTTESATEAVETTAASTGEPTAVCGNGVLEALGPVPEECDDGNLDPDDGCNEACALDRRVFVTSRLYKGADLESLYLADAQCANRADDAGWPDPLSYRAWLSDSTTDARDRLERGRGRLVLMNGLVFATSWPALLAGQLEFPLEVTEKMETYHGGVWTGTRPDGTAVPGSEHCDDWSNSSPLRKGYYGYSDRTTAEWIMADDADQPSSCPASYAIYCFQSL